MSLLANNQMFAKGNFSIANSVRSRSSNNTYFQRTASSSFTSNQKFTVSAWVKLGAMPSSGYSEYQHYLSFSTSTSYAFQIGFGHSNSSAGMQVVRYNGTGYDINVQTSNSNVMIRDPSAWYHMVVAVDTTQATSANRVITYINGVSFPNSGTMCSQNYTFPELTSGSVLRLLKLGTYYDAGSYGSYSSGGHISDVYFIDGAALDPTYFGKSDANGVWVPKAYVGNNDLPSGYTSNTCTGGTAIDSSHWSGSYLPSYAFDGTTSGNVWQPGSGETGSSMNNVSYVGYQHASAKHIRKIVLDQTTGTYAVTGIKVQNKVSGTWTDVASFTVGAGTNVLNLPASTAQTDWRILCTNNGFATYWNVNEIAMYEATGLNSYGVNGAKLEFKNAGSLGTDTSGNGNNWTATNFASTDQMVDTPTNNYATLNPIDLNGSTISNGNTVTTNPNSYVFGTIGVPSTGKWYVEARLTTAGTAPRSSYFGIMDRGRGTSLNYGICSRADTAAATGSVKVLDGTESGAGSYSSWQSINTDVGIAYDAGANTVACYVNGTLQWTQTSASTYLTTSNLMVFFYCESGAVGSVRFGGGGFNQTIPSGYKALCTANLPAVAITKPKNYFNVVTRTGNGTTQATTGVGFQPDLVWDKSRSNASSNELYDSVRGATNYLWSDSTAAEGTDANRLTSFDSDGFTMGSTVNVNGSGRTFVDWCWKKGTTPGFDIVTFSIPSSGTVTPSHALGAVPKFMIVTFLGGGQSKVVYHADTGNTKAFYLELTSAAQTVTVWNNTSPTSSVFTFNGSWAGVAQNGLAYLWAEVPGFSKFGSYTGNNSADGPFAYCGFKPRYIMIKPSSGTTGHWLVFDTQRDTNNQMINMLLPSASSAESAGTCYVDALSNGFKIRNTGGGFNDSGATFIYCAFAEHPMGGSNVSPVTAR